MFETIKVKFQDDEILLVSIDGKPYVVLRPALESIGLDSWGQIRKLKNRSWARTAEASVRDSAGRTQSTTVCDVRTFLMLLATVDENLVSPQVRPKLIAYQAEVADVIETYWNNIENIREFVNKFVLTDPRPWEKTFDDRIKMHCKRLGLGYSQAINKYFYDRFPDGVADTIRKRNPIIYAGRLRPGRAKKNHQFLTEQVGLPELMYRMGTTIGIMSAAKDKKELEMLDGMINGGPTKAIGS